jgi:hypothetical protein
MRYARCLLIPTALAAGLLPANVQDRQAKPDAPADDPRLTIENPEVHKLLALAWDLALRTVDRNAHRGILAAGADYGGEWTRDCAINAWNGNGKVFQFELENVARLALDPDKGNGNFREIYHPISGVPHGGWQSGRPCKSCSHRTWSATAFIRLALNGLAGLEYQPDGLRFAPRLPPGYKAVTLGPLKYRGLVLTIALRGEGAVVRSFRLDGKAADAAFVPAAAVGAHTIEMDMSSADPR